MIQTQLYPSRLCLLMAAIAGLCTSCSDITDSGGDTSLPDGKYPMTFTAAMDGLTATRATTDNNSQWTGNEAVNIQVGSNSKTYTTTGNGALTCTDGFYWRDKNSVNVTAWYPVDFNLTNIANQSQSDTYAKLDFLYSSPKEVSFNTTASLNFEHRMAKVTATLQAGSGLANSDLSGATVKFYGYTAATVDCAQGTIISPNNNGWITAYQSGSTYSALLIPQSPFPSGGKFISVTIGSNIYYYTPQSGDANTEAGKAYNYTITVHKSGIFVSVNGWQSMGEVTGTNDTNPYTITVTADEGISDIALTNTTTGSSGNYTYPVDATKSPVLTFKVAKEKGVTAVDIAGRANPQYTYDEANKIFSYSLANICTDLNIHISTTSEPEPQVGYYVYPDKMWTDKELVIEPAGIIYKIDNNTVYVVALTSGGYLSKRADYGGTVRNHKPAITGCNWGVSEQNLIDIFYIQEQNQDSSWPSRWQRLSDNVWYANDGDAWGYARKNSKEGDDGRVHFNKDYNGGAYLRSFCTITIETN